MLAEILTILIVVFVSRAPLRGFAFFLRAIGILRRTQQQAPLPGETGAVLNQSPDLKRQLGRSAYAFLWRAFRPDTATERALAGVDPEFPREDGKSEGPYDYAGNEEKHIARHGFLFKWIAVKPSYLADISLINDEIVDLYFKTARRFFRWQVSIQADVTSLYEDVDAAVTISMFRARDRNAYYLMHQMRRVIDDNVRKLAFLYTSILLAVLVLELFIIDHNTFFGIDISFVDNTVGGLFLCAAGAFIMWLTYSTEYSPYQRNNGRELRSFLTRYLARISDRYRDSMANARAVTVGDETEGEKLRTKAQLWHKIMMWLAFRAFFIETFVRNILFQIGRNCGYYIVLVPVLMSLLIVVTCLLLVNCFGVDLKAELAIPPLYFWVAYAVLVVLAGMLIRNSMNSIDEMNQADWLGFDNLNVDRGMDDVVGKYAEDVAFWKGRLDR